MLRNELIVIANLNVEVYPTYKLLQPQCIVHKQQPRT